MLLEESAFLARLADLYDANRTSGTVFVQMKRYAGRLASVRRKRFKRQVEAAEGQEPRCLVRARSNVKKVSKISCLIDAKDTVRFQLALGNVMRLHMDGLKRPKKKPDDKRKAKPVKKDAPEKAKAEKPAKK
mmetsp:Transcript_1972/g.4018  ORF Transcript_1972/g.4018 Transcript_1972/m.4018 type:complete len:132 (+) Transcript_1972:73-468(+)|eukprot:CAMPEP_0113819906 /NCGR_PEP_ID=MMETSP0328-20130328/973_1 /TAXON_ID=39455 /ORGANISM="Alexandrium minutum" /LENGTH=131 /DNA_ID=CAMNT_0000787839 /DNA_START=72 /DNA_END=467 /DNA_ORIENTATION=+ /assembly_acc=CAM_ASM_000350